MSLWWLQPGWTDAVCHCGARIAPEGDPDWGMCWSCMVQDQDQRRQEEEYAEAVRRQENEEMERHYREHPHG